ncbi:MAG: AAA family ATPase [Armatimonadota bacterium]
MVIGITGRNCSGKGELAEYLKKKGFIYYSLSDEIREELSLRNIPESRETLIQMGNKLRGDFGPSVLADRLLSKINKDKDYVIDSIRNPAEVASLRSIDNFTLVEIRADDKIRHERMCSRHRQGDAVSFEEFTAYEKREINNTDPVKQQVDKTIELADHVIENNSGLEELYKKIDYFLTGKKL